MTNKTLSDADLEKIRAAADTAPCGDWSADYVGPRDGLPPEATVWVEGEPKKRVVAVTTSLATALHLIHTRPDIAIAMVDELLARRRGPEITWNKNSAAVGGVDLGLVYLTGEGWRPAVHGRPAPPLPPEETKAAAMAVVERVIRENLFQQTSTSAPVAKPGAATSGAAYPTYPAPGWLKQDIARATARLAQWKARTDRCGALLAAEATPAPAEPESDRWEFLTPGTLYLPHTGYEIRWNGAHTPIELVWRGENGAERQEFYDTIKQAKARAAEHAKRLAEVGLRP